MAYDTGPAIKFVKSIDLSGTPRGILTMDAGADAGEVFDQAKTQAQVVGAGLFSFAQGVTPEVREAISDSALLAQLVANKSASAETDPLAWFAAYSNVLQNIGWTLQEGTWTDYTAQGAAVEVHNKILEVMTLFLGPSVAAVAIITATMKALEGMKPDSPWITLFSRQSQKAKIARFQIGLVEKEESSDVFVSLLACLIVAHDNITQVLFFKFRGAGATFKAKTSKVSVNRASITELGPLVRNKIRAYQAAYLSTILDV